jgi:hypothetical protein
MPPTQHEAGQVTDGGVVHAVQKKIGGNVALCGAGKIAVMVPGRFDRENDNICPDCATLAG